jgi:hypothetical protein
MRDSRSSRSRSLISRPNRRRGDQFGQCVDPLNSYRLVGELDRDVATFRDGLDVFIFENSKVETRKAAGLE